MAGFNRYSFTCLTNAWRNTWETAVGRRGEVKSLGVGSRGGVGALTEELWVQLWGGCEGEVGMTDSFL